MARKGQRGFGESRRAIVIDEPMQDGAGNVSLTGRSLNDGSRSGLVDADRLFVVDLGALQRFQKSHRGGWPKTSASLTRAKVKGRRELLDEHATPQGEDYSGKESRN